MYRFKDFGSFFVSGSVMSVTGQPVQHREMTPNSGTVEIDPNGQYMTEQMYVQYFQLDESVKKSNSPVILIHGGSLTGVSFENRPDGNPGWLHHFLKAGYDCYVPDVCGRGRSGFNRYHEAFNEEPVYLPLHDPANRFRLGNYQFNGENVAFSALDVSQFPEDSYLSFMKQVVPRWTLADQISINAYKKLVNQLYESTDQKVTLIAHSQGCLFAMKVAEEYPDQIEALVLVEPTLNQQFKNAEKLAKIPTLVLFGDGIVEGSPWAMHRQNTIHSFELIQSINHKNNDKFYQLIDLPDIGIVGNTHLPMMDTNSDDVTQLIDHWLSNHQLKENK